MTSRIVLLFFTIVVLSRLPFLLPGYGSDADSWSVARTATSLWEEGRYQPSRLPGYPLHEIISTPFVMLGGPLLSNLASVAVCCFLLFVWKGITQKVTASPLLLMIALGFFPYVWKSSVTTMDYLWSLSAILLSLRSGLDGRFVQGGVWTGIAAGFRPPNILALLPLIVLIRRNGASRRQIGMSAAAAGITAFVCFLPLIAHYGIPGWFFETSRQVNSFELTTLDRLLYFGYRLVSFPGLPAVLAMTVFLWLSRTRAAQALKRPDSIFVVSATGVATFILLFWFFPLEREYLLPAVPFGLLLLERTISRKALLVITLLLVSQAFINVDVIRHHGNKGTPEFNVHEGLLFEDHRKREELETLRRRVGELSLPGKSFVITGVDANLWVENKALVPLNTSPWNSFSEKVLAQRNNPDILFTQITKEPELDRVRKEGFRLYYLASNKEYLDLIAGFSLEEEGIEPVWLPGEVAAAER